jgi:hypothetical protein
MTVRHLFPIVGLSLGLLACEEAPPEPDPGFVPSHPMPNGRPPAKPVCDPEATFDPGPALVRRLSRVEYDNTVRMLLGDDIDLARSFTPEEEMLGFDNNARTLSVSAVHAEEFMSAAETLGWRAAQRLPELLPCDPATVGERECAMAFIDTFGLRAWRRPLTEGELAQLGAVYDAGAEDEGFAGGLSLVLEALLQSPHFLYRIEAGTPHAERDDLVELTPYEVASRLSYLVWRSMPDDALFDAAATGALSDPAQLTAQAERMLADPRAEAAIWSFVEQWLRVDEVLGVERDVRDYPDFDRQIQQLMYEETRQFTRAILQDPALNMVDFFTAPFTYVNGDLAEFYGIPGVTGRDFVRVDLDANRHRGVVTQGSLMTVTAKARMTSPVNRGVFVREHFLCTALPPPPPDVPVVPPDPDPSLSTREKFSEHSTNAACAGCHSMIDELGFTFEHYDPVGRWRDVEPGGHRVDASGSVNATWDMDGPLSGAAELAQKLGESEQAQRCVVTQVFRFANGRGENPVDGCTLNAMYDAYVDSNYDLRALFTAVVADPSFRVRRAEPDEEVVQ